MYTVETIFRLLLISIYFALKSHRKTLSLFIRKPSSDYGLYSTLAPTLLFRSRIIRGKPDQSKDTRWIEMV